MYHPTPIIFKGPGSLHVPIHFTSSTFILERELLSVALPYDERRYDSTEDSTPFVPFLQLDYQSRYQFLLRELSPAFQVELSNNSDDYDLNNTTSSYDSQDVSPAHSAFMHLFMTMPCLDPMPQSEAISTNSTSVVGSADAVPSGPQNDNIPSSAYPWEIHARSPDCTLTDDEIDTLIQKCKLHQKGPKWYSFFFQLLRRCSKLFDSTFREAIGPPVQIDYKGPIFNRHFYIKNPERLQALKTLVQDMLKKGVIERSSSPYCSPAFCVPKRAKGAWRFVIDLRALNAGVDLINISPVPIDLALNISSHKRFRSILDLTDAFHQLALAPHCRDLTAFMVPGVGQFRYKRLPQGFKNSPSFQQSQMQTLLAPFILDCLVVYLDDLLVFSETENEHKSHLWDICCTLNDANHSVKISKCEFLATNIRYLGFTLTPEGIAPASDSVDVIQQMKVPTSVPQARTLVGFFSWNRRFIHMFSQKAIPLYDYINGKGPLSSAQIAFKLLQAEFLDLIRSGKILHPMDPSLPLCIATDASNRAIGGYLYQIVNDEERSIAYFSRTLTEAERPYYDLFLGGTSGGETRQAEALAIIATLEYYDDLVRSAPEVIVNTDHRNLLWLAGNRTGRLKNWGIRFRSFSDHIKIRYQPGKTSVVQVPDCFSRAVYFSHPTLPTIPLLRQHQRSHFPSLLELLSPRGVGDVPSSPSTDDTNLDDDTSRIAEQSEEQKNDDDNRDSTPSEDEANENDVSQGADNKRQEALEDQVKSEVPILYDRRTANYRYFLDDNKLVRVKAGKHNGSVITSPVILIHERDDKMKHIILECLHNDHLHGAHQGVYKTRLLISSRFYWIGMHDDIRNYVSSCLACRLAKATDPKLQGLLRSTSPKPDWHGVSIDVIVVQKKNAKGFKYIVNVMDMFTGFLVSWPSHLKKAEVTLNEFVLHVVSKFGLPRFFHVDGQFNNRAFKSFLSLLGSEFKITITDRSQSNPVERLHRHIEELLRTFLNDFSRTKSDLSSLQYDDWMDYLPYIVLAYNSSTGHTRPFSPYSLMFGREPIFPIDLLTETVSSSILTKDWETALLEKKELIKRLTEITRRSIDEARAKNQLTMNQQRVYVEFKVGDVVLVYVKQRQSKFANRAIGPCIIRSVLSADHYTVEPPHGPPFRAHSSQMHSYTGKYVKPPVDISHALSEEYPRVASMIIYTGSDEPDAYFIGKVLFHDSDNESLLIHYYGSPEFDKVHQHSIPTNAKYRPSYTYYENGERYVCHRDKPPSGAHPICYFEKFPTLTILAKDFQLLDGIIPRSVLHDLPPSVINRANKRGRTTSADGPGVSGQVDNAKRRC